MKVGGPHAMCIAGPCAVENEEMLNKIARHVRDGGATILRGGVYKPRTSPYSFQGLGVEALRYLAEMRDELGLPVITEVMEPNQVDIVAEYADILQIGTRNMQNYSLLTAVGRVARPVMLKRGYGATVEEWLMAAEYIVNSVQTEDFRAGIDAYLTKPFEPDELIAVVNGILIRVERTHSQIARLVCSANAEEAMVSFQDEALTDAENRVAIAVSRGLSNKEIAGELEISVRTVENHISHILDKKGFSNRVEIARYVFEQKD